jgi:K+-sensing histidine kinase KdpD
MQKQTDLILRLRPWSPLAFLAALLAIGLGSALEKVFLSFGITLYFAGFVPAILMATLFAGVPAGLFATVGTIPLVWWAFMPPHFEFAPLTAADYHRFVMFALMSALAISFSRLYREALSLSRKRS